jgi:hypothetical protein
MKFEKFDLEKLWPLWGMRTEERVSRYYSCRKSGVEEE